MRTSALEVCRIVGEELVIVVVRVVGDGAEWSYRSRSGAARSSGTFDGHPVDAYAVAFEAARLEIANRPKKFEGQLIAVWDYRSKRGQVLEIQGVGRYVETGIEFPTKTEAVKFVDDWKAANR